MSDFDFDDEIPGFDHSAPREPVTMTWFKKPEAEAKKFPCKACGGTGRWQGGTNHNGSSQCFSCNGRGFFKSSDQDRAKARQSAANRKERTIAELRASFDETNPGVSAFLVAASSWRMPSDFLGSMRNALDRFGFLTENQLAAVKRTMEKVEAKRAERVAAAVEVDLSPIRAMFETAVGNGHKRPVYRAAGLVINRAPDHGKNPGALYVKDEHGEYLGKLLGTSYSGKPAPALAAIAADPKGEAVKWGQKTGTCSCCGRELTDKNSIEMGIGPVCAEKWGF